MNEKTTGALFALGAYGLWSIAAVYFKAVDFISAPEVLAHRVVWSCLLTLIALMILTRVKPLLFLLRSPRLMAGLAASTLLIAANWGVFIWAVQSGKILSASLGYYINPLVNILLGMVFLGERLNTPRRWAAGLCVAAVSLELILFGTVPIIALFLAVTFGVYGLVRKKLGIDSLMGLAVETACLLPFAVLYLFFMAGPKAQMVEASWSELAWMLAAGPVTTVPLLCFAAAANRLSLTALGFFQYIAPTGMFFLAIGVYGESVTPQKMVTFGLIWCALGILIVNSLRPRRLTAPV